MTLSRCSFPGGSFRWEFLPSRAVCRTVPACRSRRPTLVSVKATGARTNPKNSDNMPQLSGGGGGDPELCATDEMIPFKDEGDPHKEQIFAELSHSEEEGDLADIKSSLVNESESSPNSNSHDVSIALCVARANAEGGKKREGRR